MDRFHYHADRVAGSAYELGGFQEFWVNYTVVNGTAAQIANINAGGTDVEAHSYKDGITLTNTELATLLDGSSFGKNICVFPDLTGNVQAIQRKRVTGLASLYVSA